jgi:hypothetical protein
LDLFAESSQERGYGSIERQFPERHWKFDSQSDCAPGSGNYLQILQEEISVWNEEFGWAAGKKSLTRERLAQRSD